jgi:predicted nucleic-acid-binding protein
MIAVDTNVLVRYLVRDHREQAETARALLQSATAEKPAYACREVVVELVWVLERAYGYSRDRIATILEELVATEGLVVEAADDVALAAFRYRSRGAGFSDLMVLAAARRAGALPLYTFDRTAAPLEAVELLT